MSVLNGFHPSIQFTYETEFKSRLSFRDVVIICNGQSIETCVYRKPTNTGIYIHWNSFALIQWKQSTLKTLVCRSYFICSNDHYLTLELKYLRNVLRNTTTFRTGPAQKFLMISIKYLTNNKKYLSPMKEQLLKKVIPKNK